MTPKAILIAAALALSATSAAAQTEAGKDGGLALGAHVSTLGLGAEGSVKLHDTLVLRLGGNYFAADFSDTSTASATASTSS